MVCREQPAWRACAETSPCWPHRAAAALPIQESRGSLSKGAAPGAWFHLAVAYAAVVSLPLLLSTPEPPEIPSVRRCLAVPRTPVWNTRPEVGMGHSTFIPAVDG